MGLLRVTMKPTRVLSQAGDIPSAAVIFPGALVSLF